VVSVVTTTPRVIPRGVARSISSWLVVAVAQAAIARLSLAVHFSSENHRPAEPQDALPVHHLPADAGRGSANAFGSPTRVAPAAGARLARGSAVSASTLARPLPLVPEVNMNDNRRRFLVTATVLGLAGVAPDSLTIRAAEK